jgi:hypothetical protein
MKVSKYVIIIPNWPACFHPPRQKEIPNRLIQYIHQWKRIAALSRNKSPEAGAYNPWTLVLGVHGFPASHSQREQHPSRLKRETGPKGKYGVDV